MPLINQIILYYLYGWLIGILRIYDVPIVSRFMFNASSAIQIGIKSKTAGPTQKFQSISIILLDMVTPTTNIGSIFGFAYFVIIPELFALYSMNCCNR